MKTFWNNRRITFVAILVLSIVIVFFLGRTSNEETLKRQLHIIPNGITTFRKGLDISGGTKLTYRISYDKYEETYKNSQELADVKQTVENIILKNIDGRISKLGVSDYKSYTQQLDNETQIVVEIGGVADLDQAKEIIGKTVELEFKLPNEASEDTSARATLAQKLHDDIVANPLKMAELTEGRSSENVFYSKFTGANLTELPAIYQNNLEILTSLATQTETISPVLEGVYGNAQAYDASGNVTTEALNGYTFFRVVETQS
jgi:preprotein translocase subunit SecD